MQMTNQQQDDRVGPTCQWYPTL